MPDPTLNPALAPKTINGVPTDFLKEEYYKHVNLLPGFWNINFSQGSDNYIRLSNLESGTYKMSIWKESTGKIDTGLTGMTLVIRRSSGSESNYPFSGQQGVVTFTFTDGDKIDRIYDSVGHTGMNVMVTKGDIVPDKFCKYNGIEPALLWFNPNSGPSANTEFQPQVLTMNQSLKRFKYIVILYRYYREWSYCQTMKFSEGFASAWNNNSFLLNDSNNSANEIASRRFMVYSDNQLTAEDAYVNGSVNNKFIIIHAVYGVNQ